MMFNKHTHIPSANEHRYMVHSFTRWMLVFHLLYKLTKHFSWLQENERKQQQQNNNKNKKM